MSYGGGSGIRTRDTVSRMHTFQACAFNHSATPPFSPAENSPDEISRLYSRLSRQRKAIRGAFVNLSHLIVFGGKALALTLSFEPPLSSVVTQP